MDELFAKPTIIPPLFIDWVPIPGTGGVIGMTICPGKKDDGRFSGFWERNLDSDLQAIKEWGAVALVSLIEWYEFRFLRVEDLPEKAGIFGLRWMHLPMPEMGVPDHTFEEMWQEAGAQLRQLLKEGKKIVLHCNEGFGRTGVIAARLLVELGVEPDDAINSTRKARRGAIANVLHEKYVRECKPSEAW